MTESQKAAAKLDREEAAFARRHKNIIKFFHAENGKIVALHLEDNCSIPEDINSLSGLRGLSAYGARIETKECLPDIPVLNIPFCKIDDYSYISFREDERNKIEWLNVSGCKNFRANLAFPNLKYLFAENLGSSLTNIFPPPRFYAMLKLEVADISGGWVNWMSFGSHRCKLGVLTPNLKILFANNMESYVSVTQEVSFCPTEYALRGAKELRLLSLQNNKINEFIRNTRFVFYLCDAKRAEILAENAPAETGVRLAKRLGMPNASVPSPSGKLSKDIMEAALKTPAGQVIVDVRKNPISSIAHTTKKNGNLPKQIFISSA